MAVPLEPNQAQRVIDIGNAVKTQYPRAFSKCHVEGDPERLDFIILFAQAASTDALLRTTHRPGMNGKRGVEGDPSMDVLSFWHNDSQDKRDVTAADVVEGAGGSNPKVIYHDITDPHGAGAVYIDPFTWKPHYDYTAPEPPHHCLLGYSLFWVLGAERDDASRLDYQLMEHFNSGADCVRAIAHMPRHDADGTPGIFNSIGVEWSDPNFVALLRRADDRLKAWKLKWYLTFTAGIRGIEDEAKQNALVDKINEAFADRPNRRLVDEMANEYETNGLNTEIVRRMARRNAQYPNRAQWVSLSSPNTVHDGSGRDIHDEVRRMYDGLPEANAITPHWNRGTNAPPDLGPYCPPIVICGEPRGPKSSGSQTSDPSVLIEDAQKAVAADYVLYIGHSDSGFISTFMHPGPTADHGNWRLYSDHDNGSACLEALRAWRVSGTVPDPIPEPPDGGEPMIPYDEAKSIEFGHACNAVYVEAFPDPEARCNAFDPGMVSVHSSRAAWDHYVGGLSWEDSKRKHLNEFRAVYGLPPI